MPRSLYISLNSPLAITLHIPCSTTGQYTLLKIFLSHAHSLFISILVTDHVSLPNTTAGVTIVYRSHRESKHNNIVGICHTLSLSVKIVPLRLVSIFLITFSSTILKTVPDRAQFVFFPCLHFIFNITSFIKILLPSLYQSVIFN